MNKLTAQHLDQYTYGHLISLNVARKWPDQEQKEWWYTKFTMSRRKKLIKLFNQQNGICVYCGSECWLAEVGTVKSNPPPGQYCKKMATADHIIPQAHGGTNRTTNLVMACADCNSRRQTMPFEEFLELRSDPEKWKAHTQKLSREMNEREKERMAKSEVRRRATIWKLTWLFYLRPDYAALASTLPPGSSRRRRVVDNHPVCVRTST